MQAGTLLSVFTGVSAGMTEAVIVCTPDLVKVRMQDKRNAGKYTGALDVATKIVQAEGVTGLARGIEATLLRHAIWNGGYFGSISLIRSALPPAKTKEAVLLNNFVAGCIGGTIGTILNTPFDVYRP